MKMFFDTEFTGLHKNTTLISMGIVYEDGSTFYAEFTDYDKTQVDPWVQKNVIQKLTLGDMDNNTYKFSDHMKNKYVRGTKEFIALELDFWHQYRFPDETMEVWSDCLAYDWVLFNDLFGNAHALPNYINYIPFDICTLFKIAGIDPDISREEFVQIDGEKHNSLYDAKVIEACYNKLINMIKLGGENNEKI